MLRALSTCRVLLLAVLLGASPRAGASLGTPAHAAALRPGRTASALEAWYVRATARSYHTLEIRTPTERQSSPAGGVLRSSDQPALAHSLESVARAVGGTPAPAGQSRHFPLFPTGPPSRS
jgi:hypothetical protein